MRRILLFLLLIVSFPILALDSFPAISTQNIASTIQGHVKDATTLESLPFVSLRFENEDKGIASNQDGSFTLRNNKDQEYIIASIVGYESQRIKIDETQGSILEILLEPISYHVQEVVVQARKEKYSKKNNPAVELIEKVIANKNKNKIESNDNYQYERYEKLSLSLIDFAGDIKGKKWMNRFDFIFNHLDTSEFSAKPILTISVRESLSDEYRRKKPSASKSIIKAERHEGLDKTIEAQGITAFWAEAFREVNLSDNNIDLLLTQFVSPLSSTSAISFYRFYIADTILLEDMPYVEIQFTPQNNQDMGFVGSIWVSLDSSYALKKAVLNTPRNTNLNFVKAFRIEQKFQQATNGTWGKSEENTSLEIYLAGNKNGFYARKNSSFINYSIDKVPSMVFDFKEDLITLEDAKDKSSSFWAQERHKPLNSKEDSMKLMIDQLREIPIIKILLKTTEIVTSGYVNTSGSKENSPFDFGPISTFLSVNDVEGLRLRMSGTSTANLHKNLFFKGYAAYGFKDEKWKYSSTLTWSFIEKEYHENEAPKNKISLQHSFDISSPGQQFLNTYGDNIFLSIKSGVENKMTYITKTNISFEKENRKGFSYMLWANTQKETATGSLHFLIPDQNELQKEILGFRTSELGIQLRYAWKETFYQQRTRRITLNKNAPVFEIGYIRGIKDVFKSDYDYHRSHFSASKRIWLSGYGYIEGKTKVEKIWGALPYPILLLPNANSSYVMLPEAFSLMKTMEFINDQYAFLDINYHLNGWLLNRIPILKKARFREVVTFKAIKGSLSEKNMPEKNPQLFIFPEDSGAMGKTPYMEASIGLENILKIIRVDYIRRLSYIDEPDIKKHGFRIAVEYKF
ncbi:membrane protein [Bacteroidales bacterium]|nr:membrane protein [Bacteroidales bacterium]